MYQKIVSFTDYFTRNLFFTGESTYFHFTVFSTQAQAQAQA